MQLKVLTMLVPTLVLSLAACNQKANPPGSTATDPSLSTQASGPSFTIDLNPKVLSAPQNGNVSSTLTVTPRKGVSGTATLKLQGAPQGVYIHSSKFISISTTPQAITLGVSNCTPTSSKYMFDLVATSDFEPIVTAMTKITLRVTSGPTTPSSGSLDTCFNIAGSAPGIAQTNIVGGASSIALQPDGKILIAGSGLGESGNDDFVLARYNTDGTEGKDFATDGKVTTDFGLNDVNTGLGLQSDGKIVLTGYGYLRTNNGYINAFVMTRYDTNGNPDSSFGEAGNGKVMTTLVGSIHALAIQPDDKIVVAGSEFNNTDPDHQNDFVLMRYQTNGMLDTSFGNNGKTITDFDLRTDSIYTIAVQPVGSTIKIVAAGYSYNYINNAFDFALARYNEDGVLDSTFGTNGRVITDFNSSYDSASAIVVQANGSIVAAGFSGDSNYFNNDFALARYTANGVLDPNFGTNGKVTTDFNSSEDIVSALSIQADGKLVAVGSSNKSGNSVFALSRYNSDGVLDTTFGTTGKVTTALSSGYALAIDLALQPSDRKIVLVGADSNKFVLARYNP